MCVKRSGNHPLYVDLRDSIWGHPGKSYGSEYVGAVIEVLRPHLHRWKTFTLILSPYSINAFSELPLETAEILDTLEVILGLCPQELRSQIQANVAKLPTLRKLSWGKYYMWTSSRAPRLEVGIDNFPWSRLSHISLSCAMSVEETLQFFSCATSVEVMRLRLPAVQVSQPQSTSYHYNLIDLPTLRVLDIQPDDFMIYDVLQHLNIPGLEIFCLVSQVFWHSNIPNIPCSRFKEFIDRSAHSLNVLILSSFDFPKNDIPHFFGNPRLVNIATFQIHLKNCPLDEVEDSLKSALAKRGDLERQLLVHDDFVVSVVGWVDHDSNLKYFDGFGELCDVTLHLEL